MTILGAELLTGTFEIAALRVHAPSQHQRDRHLIRSHAFAGVERLLPAALQRVRGRDDELRLGVRRPEVQTFARFVDRAILPRPETRKRKIVGILRRQRIERRRLLDPVERLLPVTRARR